MDDKENNMEKFFRELEEVKNELENVKAKNQELLKRLDFADAKWKTRG